MKSGALIALLLVGAVAQAATPKVAKQFDAGPRETYDAYVKAVTGANVDDDQAAAFVVNDDEMKKEVASLVERSKRSPANANVASLSGDPAFVAFVNSINACKTGDELDAKLKAIDEGYDKLPNNLKFYAAILTPMRSIRGLAWRMIPLFPNSRVLHSLTLSAFQRVISLQETYFPTNQWDALKSYATEPYTADGKLAAQFHQESDIQRLTTELYVALGKSALRLKNLDVSDANPVLIDKKMIYGAGTFRDSIDRYRLVGGLEKNMIMTGIYGGMSRLAASRAYSNYGFLSLNQGLGELYGMSHMISLDPSKVEGATAQDRASAVRRTAQFDVLMPDGKVWMGRSMLFLKSSLITYKIFNSAVHKMDASRDDAFLIDPTFFKGNEREMDAALASIDRMLAGRTTIVSHVTGESVEVDVPAFYANPPQDMKALLPTAFQAGASWATKSLTVDGKPQAVSYRNYSKGRPIGWNKAAYSTLFPTLKDSASVAPAARILAQSWGGTPINSFLFDYLQ